VKAEEVLNEDHFGLERSKNEFSSISPFATGEEPEGIDSLLRRPAGVGKTSLEIDRASYGRKFVALVRRRARRS
jgi:ATP-dependent Lon protease